MQQPGSEAGYKKADTLYPLSVSRIALCLSALAPAIIPDAVQRENAQRFFPARRYRLQ